MCVTIYAYVCVQVHTYMYTLIYLLLAAVFIELPLDNSLRIHYNCSHKCHPTDQYHGFCLNIQTNGTKALLFGIHQNCPLPCVYGPCDTY